MFNLKDILPPIYGGTKTLKGDLKWGTKKIETFPKWFYRDVMLKPERRNETFTESMAKFGQQTRNDITKPVTAFTKGLVGKGAWSYLKGEQGYIPNWGWKPNGQGKKTPVLDTSGEGKGLVNVDLPDVNIPPINIPKFQMPKIEIPKVDLSPLDLSKLQMPSLNMQMPSILPSGVSTGITDEDGNISTLGMGMMALAAIVLLKEVK